MIANQETVIEDGMRVIYVTTPDSLVHRYEETAEVDSRGMSVFDYTGVREKPMDPDHPVYQRALVLQSEGPDEFPFGYYLYLAEQESGF